MGQLTLELDEGLLSILRDLREPAQDAARELIVIELHRRHLISLSRAAQVLGMPLLDYIQYSGSLGIPYLDYDDEELDREFAAAKEIAARVKA